MVSVHVSASRRAEDNCTGGSKFQVLNEVDEEGAKVGRENTSEMPLQPPKSKHKGILKDNNNTFKANTTNKNLKLKAGCKADDVYSVKSGTETTIGASKTCKEHVRKGNISVGGELKDDAKQWIIEFAMNKGKGSVLEAEL
ncbi:hypothetical protein ACOSQ2_004846 [Xanthoceras sorbifolium]